MILRRFGNKSKIAKEIQKYFPPHKIYIEPFFGAGGMIFNKPQVEVEFCNDADNDVYNLFIVLKSNKDELIKRIEETYYHTSIIDYFKNESFDCSIDKAVKFLFLSNFTFLGKGNTLNFESGQRAKETLINNLLHTPKRIEYIRFTNCDFRDFFNKISFNKIKFGKIDDDKKYSFCYSDPPYLGADNNYNMQSNWTEKDVIDCMNITFNSGIKGAMSEFNHTFILQQAKERNLNVITIGERQNLKNRRTEILITNYQPAKSLFDDCA